MPCVNVVVWNVARPPVPIVALRTSVPPSRKLTVPVIVPAVVEVTVAVNTTFVPVVDGLSDDTRAVDVAAFEVEAFTTCEIAVEVDVA